jgi:hypothetical protein
MKKRKLNQLDDFDAERMGEVAEFIVGVIDEAARIEVSHPGACECGESQARHAYGQGKCDDCACTSYRRVR